MRAEQKVLLIYQFSEKLSQLLNWEIKGKSVSSWILFFLEFSFIIWLSINFALGLKLFFQYKELQQKIYERNQLLQVKRTKITTIKLKLQELETTYKILSKIFTVQAIQNLNNKLYESSFSVKKEKDIIAPLKYESFNYPFYIKKLTISNLLLESFITNNFKKSLLKQVNLLFQNKQKLEKSGSIDLILEENNFILFFTPKGGSLHIKPTILLGFVKDIYSYNEFLASTFIPPDAMKYGFTYSPLIIGWKFEIKGE